MSAGIDFAPVFHTATRDYECDGCLGEMGIHPGSVYAYSRRRLPNGRFMGMRLCIRCLCAIQAKISRGGKTAVKVERGGLTLDRCSSAFRKAWMEVVRKVDAEPDEFRDAILAFQRKMGLNEWRQKDMEELKEQRKKRIFRRDAARLKKAVVAERAFLQRLEAAHAELVKARLNLAARPADGGAMERMTGAVKAIGAEIEARRREIKEA